MTSAEDLIELLAARQLTIATAESLTGGLVCAALTSVPGASEVVQGGIVAYATKLKAKILDVDEQLLGAEGPVSPMVAQQMAEGAAQRMGAAVAVSTTGVAGPEPQGGKEVGKVFIACTYAGNTAVEELSLHGSREEIREQTVLATLKLAIETIS